MMIKIGDFAKLSRVTVRTLRYYEEVGLLMPVQVDRLTGYRYYVASQLPRLHRILALKDLGFALDQIALVLRDELPLAELRGMLRLKQAELAQQVAESQERVARIEARLRQIEQEGTMSNYEVIVKPVPAQLVAAARGVIPTQEAITSTFNHLFDLALDYAGRNGAMAGPGIALWHDPGNMERDMPVEAAMPISRPLPATDQVTVYELPTVETMACVVHHGSFDGLGQAYNAVLGWIEANGYTINGPSREVYLGYDRHGDPAQYVTEIQFPVTR